MKRTVAFGAFLALLAAIAIGGVACGDGDNATAAGLSGSAFNRSLSLQAQAGVPEGIIVSGQSTISVTPDTALLSTGVSVLAASAVEARDQAADSMKQLIDSVKGNGVDDKDIRTTQFSLNPEYDYSSSGSPRLTGYRVTHMLSVKVKDLDNVAQVIDDAVDAAGNPVQVGGVTFTVENPDAVLSSARAGAMAEAKAKAQELANLSGVTLGAPVSIAETSSGGQPSPLYYEAAKGVGVAGATSIQPGQLDVTVNIQVTYGIQ
jgi:uncharacterized protein YggE